MERLMLVILDGLGLGDKTEANAFYRAKTPFIDELMRTYPTTRLNASGEEVGLPKGQIGNSEVGHLNIGAGRIVYQDLSRINKDIENGKFFENEELINAMTDLKKSGKSLHLMGLVSKGGVHSSFYHLIALLKMAKNYGLEKVYVHAFLDGRDVVPKSALADIKELEDFMAKEKIGQMSTIVGRYYAMDRDKRWDRIEIAYKALVDGEGKKAEDSIRALEESINEGLTDEFAKPIILDGKRIEKEDTVIFFNFRADRARQISLALGDKNFSEFKTKDLDLNFLTLTPYDDYDFARPIYREEEIKNTLGEYLSSKGLSQLRIAETEKYAHVTFFFNGGEEDPYPNEYRILISSPKVATYDEKPEMSAEELTDQLIAKIRKEKFDYITVNYANPDMVGHTGKLDAAIKAVEAVDAQLKRLVKEAEDHGYKIIITADHGNCEKMKEDGTGAPYTAHTTSQVPMILIGEDAELAPGKLANIAPTILDIMGLEKPAEMTEESLIRRK